MRTLFVLAHQSCDVNLDRRRESTRRHLLDPLRHRVHKALMERLALRDEILTSQRVLAEPRGPGACAVDELVLVVPRCEPVTRLTT